MKGLEKRIQKCREEAGMTQEALAECYLCGNHRRSLMRMFWGRDDLGVICVNDWYVMDMQIWNLDGMVKNWRWQASIRRYWRMGNGQRNDCAGRKSRI